MKAERIALIVAVAAAAALRLWDLAGRPLWLDESWSRWMAEQGWAGLLASARAYDAHPPLYYSLLKLWHGIAGATPLGLRSLSVLAGLALVPLAWAAARRAGLPRRAAPFAATAVALSPVLVVASRQARPYAPFALAFALALWAALTLLNGGRRRALAWLTYLAALELVLWLHGLGALFAAALGGGLLAGLALQRRLRRELVPFLAVHALAGLAWLPCLLAILEQRQAWTDTWLRFVWAEVPAGLVGGLAAPGVAGLPVLLLALLGGAALLRDAERRPAGLLLAAVALVPAALAILVSAVSSPIFLPRTLAPSALPVLLLAAAGLGAIAGRPARAAAGVAALAFLLASSIAQVARPPEERWDALAALLEERVRPGEEVWLLPNELALPLGFAGHDGARVRGIPAPFPAPAHVGPRYSGTRAVPGIGPDDAARLVADARARGVGGVWLVSRFAFWFDPERRLRRTLGRPVAAERGFAPLIVEYYRLQPEA